ncbi:MAG TPA: lipase secretion chaperone [Albitalea sp.]|nr:lipase secretion chaperone [Albitalea sp.]
MDRSTRRVAGAAVAGLLLAAWLWSGRDDPDPARPASLAAAPAPRSAPLRVVDAALSAASAASAARDPVAFGRWLTEHSSLRDTVLDGAWDVDSHGQLHPSIALRRRFDQLLSLVGEAGIDEITAFIRHDVGELAGPAAADRVLDLWQRYLGLQQQSFRAQVDLHDRRTWAAALAERQQARRQWLGPEVAAAFFADDEAQLQALMQGSPVVGAVPIGSAIDRNALSPQARQRLQKQEAAWADWERRLADARREWASLQSRTELSEMQRAQAMEQAIAGRFDATELVRVRALLHLPPSGSGDSGRG